MIYKVFSYFYTGKNLLDEYNIRRTYIYIVYLYVYIHLLSNFDEQKICTYYGNKHNVRKVRNINVLPLFTTRRIVLIETIFFHYRV